MTFEEVQLLLQSIAISQRETQEIVQSNSRAVQAMLYQAATDRLRRKEERAEYENRIELDCLRITMKFLSVLNKELPHYLNQLMKTDLQF
jgi:hypothetical protein